MSAQAAYISTYIFYIVAVALAVVYYRRFSERSHTLDSGGVSTESMYLVDFAGIGLLVAWYSMGLFAPKGAKVEEINPLLLGVGMVTQLIPCGVVLMVLSLRGVDLSKLFNIRWKKWYLVFVISPIVVFITLMFNLGLSQLGYETWMQSQFGSDASEQEIIGIYQATDEFWVRGMMAVMVIIIAPVTEEIVFRGYIYPVTKKFTGRFFAILMTSLLFAVVHLNIMAILPLAFLAILLTVSYEKTGSIWAPISIHALFNAFTVLNLELLRSLAL